MTHASKSVWTRNDSLRRAVVNGGIAAAVVLLSGLQMGGGFVESLVSGLLGGVIIFAKVGGYDAWQDVEQWQRVER